MPLYFGLPLNLEELLKILNVPIQFTPNEKYTTREEYITREYYKLLKIVEMETKSKMTHISLHHTDKGQIVLGYEIGYFDFIDIDNFTILMIDLKNKFEREIESFNIEPGTILNLTRIEYDPLVVNNLKPYLVFYG